jgi:acylphosphatase
VRNLPGGRSVEVLAEGPRAHLERLLAHLRVGPGGAVVHSVDTVWGTPTDGYDDFGVTH